MIAGETTLAANTEVTLTVLTNIILVNDTITGTAYMYLSGMLL